MKANDRRKFLEIVLGFAELRGRQLSAPALELYWKSMQRWSIEDFEQAAEQLLRTCKFMPMPDDFENLLKAGRPTAGEAFAKALKHACSSAWRSGPLGDPLIDRAVDSIGGYVVIAMCDQDKTPFLERRFAEHYESIQDAQDTREALPALTATKQLNGSQPKSIKDLFPSVQTP